MTDRCYLCEEVLRELRFEGPYVKARQDDDAQEELVDDLEVRPRLLQVRLLLVRVAPLEAFLPQLAVECHLDTASMRVEGLTGACGRH